MPESSAILLHRHFSKLSDDTLRLCATHFDEGTLKVPDNHQGVSSVLPRGAAARSRIQIAYPVPSGKAANNCPTIYAHICSAVQCSAPPVVVSSLQKFPQINGPKTKAEPSLCRTAPACLQTARAAVVTYR